MGSRQVFQIKGWQVRKRPVGARPRIEVTPSAAAAPNERWSTDLCRIWAGKDRWVTLALVMDYHTRELSAGISRKWQSLDACGRARASPHRPLRDACRVADPFLQPSASAPGTGHEDTDGSIQISSLTRADSAGSIHCFRIAMTCSSLNLDLFIIRLLGWDGSYLKLEEEMRLRTASIGMRMGVRLMRPARMVFQSSMNL